jgi:hypothetical protein
MVCATTIGLTERLKTALAAFGTDEQRLTPQRLATLDQFHTRGLALVPAYHECLHRAARTRYASERCRRTWPAAIRAGVDERNLRRHRKTHTDASDRETAGDVSGTFRRYKPTASTDQPQLRPQLFRGSLNHRDLARPSLHRGRTFPSPIHSQWADDRSRHRVVWTEVSRRPIILGPRRRRKAIEGWRENGAGFSGRK